MYSGGYFGHSHAQDYALSSLEFKQVHTLHTPSAFAPMSFEVAVQEEGEQGAMKTFVVKNDKVKLSEMQKDLCKAFKRRFPSTMASLTVGEETYEEFHAQPFHKGAPTQTCIVKFSPTDTPYFYDVIDRTKGGKKSLADEMETPEPVILPALDGIQALS